MPVKVVFGHHFNNVGPKVPGLSEVHWYMNSPSNTLDPALNQACVDLMNARTELMGNNMSATGYRCSIPGQRRRTKWIYAGVTGPGNNPINDGPVQDHGPAEPPPGAIAMTIVSSSMQVHRTWLGGLPDALFETGAIVGPNFAASALVDYQALWAVYTGLLVKGSWGFRALAIPPNPQPVPIAFWQQNTNAPFNLNMVLANNVGYTPNVGEIVHVRSVLMGTTAALRPIGKWKILSTSAVDANNTAYELDQSSAYEAVLVQQPGTVESVTYEIVPYATILELLQTGHKRGVGPVRPRGRSKRPARRQPV